jgi:hypothetical protein
MIWADRHDHCNLVAYEIGRQYRESAKIFIKDGLL